MNMNTFKPYAFITLGTSLIMSTVQAEPLNMRVCTKKHVIVPTTIQHCQAAHQLTFSQCATALFAVKHHTPYTQQNLLTEYEQARRFYRIFQCAGGAE